MKWEKTSVNHVSDKELISRIYKELQTNNSNKNLFKTGKVLE